MERWWKTDQAGSRHWRRGMAAAGLALTLVLAGCGPGDGGQQPTETGAVPTIPPTLGPVATGVGTEAPEITRVPLGTREPSGPLVVRSSRVVGLPVVDMEHEAIGTAADVVVAADGRVRYIIVDFTDAGGPGVTAVEWSRLQPQAVTLPADSLADPPGLPDEALVFLGSAADVQETALWTPADGEASIIRTESGAWPKELDHLLRLGGALSDFNLSSTTGDDLGEIEGALLDLADGRVLYGLADVGGFLGLAERTVAVPWDRLRLLQDEGQEPEFLLDIDPGTLERAPGLDTVQLPDFPAPALEGWDADVRNFWNEAGALAPGDAWAGTGPGAAARAARENMEKKAAGRSNPASRL